MKLRENHCYQRRNRYVVCRVLFKEEEKSGEVATSEVEQNDMTVIAVLPFETQTMSDQPTTDALRKELEALCKSALLSVDCLRERIERHGCVVNNNIHVENYDFFLLACRNERLTEGILRYLLEHFPDAASYTTCRRGSTPLHYMCFNKNVSRGMVQLLIDAYPESIDRGDIDGVTPLHMLCLNKLEDSFAVDILGLLLERCPEAAQRAQGDGGSLPIHVACGLGKSPEFCRMLIEAHPGSERIANSKGTLPLHIACGLGAAATAEYLYKLYPESINAADTDGRYPIHYAMTNLSGNPAIAFEMMQFLLYCDPSVALQKWNGNFPLVASFYIACNNRNNASIFNAAVKILHLLYDAHPEVIEDDEITKTVGRQDLLLPREVLTFINTQLTYARQARDSTFMSTRDENGQLPLHRALQRDDDGEYNITLGSIKLLVKGNRDALRIPDNDGALPVHEAIQNHDYSHYSTKVVDYLAGLDPNTLTYGGWKGNTALHYACLKADYDIIAFLLEKYGALSVSKRNVDNKLPIHLLLENDLTESMDEIEYMESAFLLLRAYPETVMMSEDDEQQSLSERGCLSRIGGKKRKFCAN